MQQNNNINLNDDHPSYYGVGSTSAGNNSGSPIKIQLLGNVLAGIALIISNGYLLPKGAFNDGVAAYSYMLITPSIILFLTLFSVLYMGLIRIWLFLVVGVALLSGLIIFGMGA